ncbi:hypothetical protein UlMin_006132 [Ulmus minor]
MAPRKPAQPSSRAPPIPIGDCEVTVEANRYACKSVENNLEISFTRNSKVIISVRESVDKKNENGHVGYSKSEEKEELDRGFSHGEEVSFVLINPKDVNNSSRSYLQEVLKMYMKELPAMNYAANTGKQSTFLEKCVMNGKYCTLLLKFKSVRELGEVIAAITYQIVPADMQYAEIPLAAVSSVYQHKGLGRLLFTELRKRLQSVGICSILCWGDKESEAFWHKQGFVSVAEVDIKGRARRFPIKSDVRRALCFPGGSTLMVSHLKQDASAYSADSLKLDFSIKPNVRSSSNGVLEIQLYGCPSVDYHTANAQNQSNSTRTITETSQPEMLLNDVLPGQDNKLDGSHCQDEMMSFRELPPLAERDCNKLACVVGSSKPGADADVKHCSCSTQGSRAKRIWESSLSSLKSKKIKGGHSTGCQLESNWELVPHIDESGSFQRCSLATSKNKGHPHRDLFISSAEKIAENCGPAYLISDASDGKESHSQTGCFQIMLMNIADNAKKAHLTKVIGDLGGTLTTDGSTSTHVITGKVRQTFNFCTALCSGAWIVSPCWLKESFRQGRFVDELPYILNDEDYVMKYRAELRSAVLKAKANPGALFKGYDVCIASHIQPSSRTLSAIVWSSGGKVIGCLSQVNEPSKTIFLACEEDMEETKLAVKKGTWTFSSEWFMNCVMRQNLDLEAPQFAESL